MVLENAVGRCVFIHVEEDFRKHGRKPREIQCYERVRISGSIVLEFEGKYHTNVHKERNGGEILRAGQAKTCKDGKTMISRKDGDAVGICGKDGALIANSMCDAEIREWDVELGQRVFGSKADDIFAQGFDFFLKPTDSVCRFAIKKPNAQKSWKLATRKTHFNQIVESFDFRPSFSF